MGMHRFRHLAYLYKWQWGKPLIAQGCQRADSEQANVEKAFYANKLQQVNYNFAIA